ncbi:MAG: Two-component system, OmpR family, response regulator [Amycolatopsis sp.]|jgi:two-component system OmpR family response regulator|uniref:response regulator transcription factor n=1 Tax=Amycolatopsis sp. TaxID=37632 RepID=UPI002634BAC0|nr:response regulator transcription factor [Amycolatopsis sp.]MCU1684573.1 Two-component system, OmpR family, response regulator [Amycolatopsis sp.]
MKSSPAARPSTILVVDDEVDILELLTAALELSGFTVFSAATGAGALAMAAKVSPDILVLDVMLPDYDGFTVAQLLRAEGNDVPVLFLSARDALEDRLAGLTAGGDDYVSKPFSLDEVVMRIRAILRRTASHDEDDELLRYADLELDEAAREARRGGRTISLSPTEFNLLRYLLVNSGSVVSKSQIFDRVWNADFVGDTRVIESYISYLRRKIDSTGPPLIHTIRGVGYSLRLPRTGDEQRSAQ